MNKIWCLFSVENNYDQPNNNLECWFLQKPSIEELMKFWGIELVDTNNIVKIVELWSGKPVRITSETEFRLEEISEGFINELNRA